VVRLHEVEYLDLAFGGDLHVGGFQIPMDDPFLMGGFEPFGDLTADVDGLIQRNAVMDADAES